MKKSVVFLVFIVLSQLLTAQEMPQGDVLPSKAFYVELGGPGVIMSANFDARFKQKERLGLGYRLGAGFAIGEFYDKFADFTEDSYDRKIARTVYTFPIGINYILGNPNKSSTFEVGAGISLLSRRMSLFTYEAEREGNVLGYLTFMYRIAPRHSGFTFRTGFTPIIGTSGDLVPMVAVALGYAF